MFKLVALAALLALAFGANLPVEKVRGIGQAPIVGGDLAVISDAPWQVALLFDGLLECGGSIISPIVILTAGHCTYRMHASRWTVRAGSNFHASGGEKHQVTKVVVHESYSQNNYDYDIAVFILATPITIDNINTRIIPLPVRDQNVTAGSDALITGWGSTSLGSPYPGQLRKVIIPIIEQAACIDAYVGVDRITPRMICAGLIDEGGKDACHGDGGGPLIVDGVVIGVGSWGDGCGYPGSPGVWARVPALVDWVLYQLEWAH